MANGNCSRLLADGEGNAAERGGACTGGDSGAAGGGDDTWRVQHTRSLLADAVDAGADKESNAISFRRR